MVLLYILYCHSWKGPMWVEMHWIWTSLKYNMRILQVAFLLLFNQLTITIFNTAGKPSDLFWHKVLIFKSKVVHITMIKAWIAIEFRYLRPCENAAINCWLGCLTWSICMLSVISYACLWFSVNCQSKKME